MVDRVNRASSIYRYHDDWYALDHYRRAHGDYKTPPRRAEEGAEDSRFRDQALRAVTALAKLLQAAQLLKHTADAMCASTAASSFRLRKADSSNTDVLRVHAKEGATITEHRVRIISAALPQRTTGKKLAANQPSIFQTGTNRFILTMNEHERAISIYLPAGITNENALHRIRSAVNNAQMTIQAHLASDDSDGTISIEFLGKQTGTHHAFSLRDETGNLIWSSGAHRVSQHAVNASWSINCGNTVSGPGNEITLDSEGKVTGWIRNTSLQTITVTITPDYDAVLQQTSELIDRYNALLHVIKHEEETLDTSLFTTIEEAAALELEAVGIHTREQDQLLFDEPRLRLQLTSQWDAAKELLIGPGGLASRISESLGSLFSSSVDALLHDRYAGLSKLLNGFVVNERM